MEVKSTALRRRRMAFTLAEILITLSIIGVVAALTIPTLIQRTGNEEYVSRLMKAYSTLSQATEAIMTENGGVKTWLTDVDVMYDLYKSHLRNSKECSSASGCLNQGSFKYLNSENTWNFDEHDNYRKLILADGAQLIFAFVSNDCNRTAWGSKNYCGGIFVDINGEKQPNRIGRDVFYFVLKADGLYPAGCGDDGLESDCNSNNNAGGHGCACKVIQEGAMNY